MTLVFRIYGTPRRFTRCMQNQILTTAEPDPDLVQGFNKFGSRSKHPCLKGFSHEMDLAFEDMYG